MELVERISLYLIGGMMSFGVIAQEQRLNFQQRLMLQEKQERKQLEQMIESASDEEYRAYLGGQLSQAMNAKGTNTATVIVDVTSLSNTPLVEKNVSRKSFGAIKLESLMAQTHSTKARSTISQASLLTIINRQKGFSNKAGNQNFEQISVEIGGIAVETLLKSSDVKDIFITTGSQYGTQYSAINTELGRFYPPVVTKTYDDDFLRKGYLDDLLIALEHRKVMNISVTLNGFPKEKFLAQEGYFLSDQEHSQGKQLTKEVLSDLRTGSYEVGSKGSYGFTIVAGKDVVKQLSKDSRVDMISESIQYDMF